MDHQLITKWLELPTPTWPPDHYTLLGLERDACNAQQIEQAVHDRLAKLRRYQISHPELATQAMNQLAQAFMCLSDAQAKAEYDDCRETAVATLPTPPPVNGETTNRADGKPPAVPAVPVLPKDLLETPAPSHTTVDWKNQPPPVRSDVAPADEAPTVNGLKAPTQKIQKPTEPVAEPADKDFERATASMEARRGLGTFPAVLERIDITRQLLYAWDKIGRYLKKSIPRLSESIELDFHHWLEEIEDLLTVFPRLLGQPGRPGYRVVAMSRLPEALKMLQAIDKDHRKDLERDWEAGRVVLTKHRQFLLQEFKRLRNKSILGRLMRALRTGLNEYAVWVYLAMIVAAVGLAWMIWLT